MSFTKQCAFTYVSLASSRAAIHSFLAQRRQLPCLLSLLAYICFDTPSSTLVLMQPTNRRTVGLTPQYRRSIELRRHDQATAHWR